MDGKDHVACAVGEDRVGVGGGVVQELFAFLHIVLCGICLFQGKGTEGSEHCSVNDTGIE